MDAERLGFRRVWRSERWDIKPLNVFRDGARPGCCSGSAEVMSVMRPHLVGFGHAHGPRYGHAMAGSRGVHGANTGDIR